MIKFSELFSQEQTTKKSGKLCLHERGGSYSNTGTVRIIGDRYGEPKEAVEVHTKGDLACGDHAAIPVEVGDHIIEAERHRDNINIAVGKISAIAGGTVKIRGALEDINGVGLTDMIDAAIAKVYDYHCRRAYYINNH